MLRRMLGLRETGGAKYERRYGRASEGGREHVILLITHLTSALLNNANGCPWRNVGDSSLHHAAKSVRSICRQGRTTGPILAARVVKATLIGSIVMASTFKAVLLI